MEQEDARNHCNTITRRVFPDAVSQDREAAFEAFFRADGVDLLKPCDLSDGGGPCWLEDANCTSLCNELLRVSGAELVNRPGALCMTIGDPLPSYDDDVSFRAEFLKSWLLTHHLCYDRDDYREQWCRQQDFRNRVSRMLPGYASSHERINNFRHRLKETGVDLLKPCSSAVEENCWLESYLPQCNKILHRAALQINGFSDGGLEMCTLRCVTVEDDTDTSLEEFLKDWLLTYHDCFRVLRIGGDISSRWSFTGLQRIELSSTWCLQPEVFERLKNCGTLEHIALEYLPLLDSATAEGIKEVIAGNVRLKSFQVHRRIFESCGLAGILGALKNCPLLESLVLNFRHDPSDVTPEATEALGQLFQSAKSLKQMTIPAGILKAVLKSSPTSCHLQELSFAGLGRGDGLFACEFQAFFRCLVVLNLRSLGLGNHDAILIGYFVEKSATIEELDLSQNRIGDDGFIAIAGALSRNRSLRKLWLQKNIVTLKSLLELGNALCVNNTVEFIDLSDLGLPDDYYAAAHFDKEVCAGLFRRVHITWKNGMLKHLAAILRRGDHVHKLSIESEEPNDALEDIIDALSQNTTVTELSLVSPGIADLLSQQIAELLRKTASLRCFERYLVIDDEDSAIKILNSLSENKTVASFSAITMFQFSASFLEAILKLFEFNDVLNSLSLDMFSPVDSWDNAKAIASGLQRNHTLLRLDISGLHHFDDCFSDVLEALRRNRALLDTAARFVTGEIPEERFAEAFRMVRRSWALVSEVSKQTGEGERGALQEIEAALSRDNSQFV